MWNDLLGNILVRCDWRGGRKAFWPQMKTDENGWLGIHRGAPCTDHIAGEAALLSGCFEVDPNAAAQRGGDVHQRV